MSNLNFHRPKMVVGNWKMNGSIVTNQALVTAILTALKSVSGVERKAKVAVCVPFPYLAQVQDLVQNTELGLGAQDLSVQLSGAYTGEVSANMLNDFGVNYVLVGHSERRSMHGESSQLVAQKAQQALASGLQPIVCLGETLTEREANKVFEVLDEQLAPVFALGADAVAKMVFAYEPVWAIGTGKTASPEEAQEVHAFLRNRLADMACQQVAILYGGSVKAANAKQLFAMTDIDGGLIGGAALDSEEFMAIVNAANVS